MAGHPSDRQGPVVRGTMGMSLDTWNPFIVAILGCEPDRVLWPGDTQECLAARAGAECVSTRAAATGLNPVPLAVVLLLHVNVCGVIHVHSV